MRFNLLENAMDSLSEAIEYYVNGKKYSDERCYKFCIIMLYHSAELILKEVLVREHKTLIYEQVDDYRNGKNAKTIGLRVALLRVRNICNIDLLKYNEALINLSDTRNKIQHYEANEETDVLISTIISAFSAIEHLVYNVLKESFDNFESIIDSSEIKTLHEDKQAYIKRKADISDDICSQNLSKVSFQYSIGKNIYIPCPKCAESFLVQSNDRSIKCYYCGSLLKLFYTVQKLTASGVQELLEKMACFYRHAIFVSLTLH